MREGGRREGAGGGGGEEREGRKGRQPCWSRPAGAAKVKVILQAWLCTGYVYIYIWITQHLNLEHVNG